MLLKVHGNIPRLQTRKQATTLLASSCRFISQSPTKQCSLNLTHVSVRSDHAYKTSITVLTFVNTHNSQWSECNRISVRENCERNISYPKHFIVGWFHNPHSRLSRIDLSMFNDAMSGTLITLNRLATDGLQCWIQIYREELTLSNRQKRSSTDTSMSRRERKIPSDRNDGESPFHRLFRGWLNSPPRLSRTQNQRERTDASIRTFATPSGGNVRHQSQHTCRTTTQLLPAATCNADWFSDTNMFQNTKVWLVERQNVFEWQKKSGISLKYTDMKTLFSVTTHYLTTVHRY